MIPSDYVAIEQRARVKRNSAERESAATRTAALEALMTASLARITQLEMDVQSLMLGAGAITEHREVRPLVMGVRGAAPVRVAQRYGNVLRVG